jgi:hypothetical protein
MRGVIEKGHLFEQFLLLAGLFLILPEAGRISRDKFDPPGTVDRVISERRLTDE